jgi:hypothetical protein
LKTYGTYGGKSAIYGMAKTRNQMKIYGSQSIFTGDRKKVHDYEVYGS